MSNFNESIVMVLVVFWCLCCISPFIFIAYKSIQNAITRKKERSLEKERRIIELDDEIRETKENYDTQIETMRAEHALEIRTIKEEVSATLEDMKYSELTYIQVNEIVTDIIEELWSNKYGFNYAVRDAVVVPDMDKDIQDFSTEVFSALSENVKINIAKYYNMEYFIKKITRQSTAIFIKYLKENKPPSK